METISKEAPGAKKIIQINEQQVRTDLRELVRGSVEETLNALLEQESDELCGAKRYERSAKRQDTRAGSYRRKLQTQAGEVKLNVPKLRTLPFETQIIKRYQRRESSVEEALIEMYLAGVSVRRVEDITEALWGTRVSPSTVSELNQKVYVRIDEWRTRSLKGSYAFISLDGIVLKRSWGGEVKNISVLVAMGVDQDGYREVLGTCEGCKEDKAGWLDFLKSLKTRGLEAPKLITSDKCLGLVEASAEVFPQTHWQRCVVHWYRNIFSKVPSSKVKDVAAMLKAIHAQEDLEAAEIKISQVVEKLRNMKLKAAADWVKETAHETLQYMHYPREYWKKLRTNNPLERIMREIRRRTRVVGAFPDGHSALMLVAARLRHISATKWGTRKYLDMCKLNEQQMAELAG